MAYIRNAYDENKGRDSSHNHNTPDGINIATTSIGDTEESYCNTAFDSYSTGGVEKFRNKEELWDCQYCRALIQNLQQEY